jgi:hypothetical protein
MPPAKVLEDDDFQAIDPVQIMCDGSKGVDDKEIKTGLSPDVLLQVFTQVNERLKQNKGDPAYFFSDKVKAHFTRPNPADSYVVCAELTRYKKETVVTSQNPLFGLFVADLVTENDKPAVRFENLMYFTDGLHPTDLNEGYPPFVPTKIIPFDPARFAPAYIVHKIAYFLDSPEEGNEEKMDLLFTLLNRFLNFFLKGQSNGRVFGRYSTVTTVARREQKLYTIMCRHNVDDLDVFQAFGLFELVQAEITDMTLAKTLSTKGKLLIQIFSTRVSKKRARDVQPIEAEEVQPVIDDVEVPDQIFAYNDKKNGMPDPEIIVRNYHAGVNPPQAAAGPDAKVPLKKIPLCPVYEMIKRLFEDNPQSSMAFAKDSLVRLVHKALQGLPSILSNLPDESDGDKVVWKPNGIHELEPDQSLVLEQIRKAIRFLAKTHGKFSISFANFLVCGGHALLSDVVHELASSAEVRRCVFARLNLLNEASQNAMIQKNDIYALFFSLVHDFAIHFVKKANKASEKLCARYNMKITNVTAIPDKKNLANLMKEDEDSKAICASLCPVLNKKTHRFSHDPKIVHVTSEASFYVYVYYDDANNRFQAVMKKPFFDHAPQVFADDDVLSKDALGVYISKNPAEMYARLTNMIQQVLMSVEFSESEQGTVLRLQQKQNAVLLTYSALMNLVNHDRHYSAFLFDFDDKGHELIGVLSKDTFSMNDLVHNKTEKFVELLEDLGDTDCLTNKFAWIHTSALRALVLVGLMPVFAVSGEGDDLTVKMERIPALVIEDKKVIKINKRFDLEDLHDLPEELPHSLADHVPHDVFAGLARD